MSLNLNNLMNDLISKVQNTPEFKAAYEMANHATSDSERNSIISEARVGYTANNLITSNSAANSGYQFSARPGFGGNDFAARASVSINNRDPYSASFASSFAQPSARQASTESNPSNASTKMQDGKAVYNSDTYTITVDEKDSSVNIFNKRSKETYKAHGDPHMDIDGKHAFDFYGKTSLQLADGTKVTIDTVDAENQTTYSSKVTITNGDYGVQILGADEKKTGDLAIKEFRGRGQELDRKVADGVVLEENENMTINGGRGFVVSDKNGVQKEVDQKLINEVDLKKTLGQSSQNVNQFDDLGFDKPEPSQVFGGHNHQDCFVPNDESETSSFEMQAPQNQQYVVKNRFEALQSLMNLLKPSSWSENFTSREKPRKPSFDDENLANRQQQRPAIRAKVNVRIPEGMNNFDVKVAMSMGNDWSLNTRVYG